MQVLHFGISVLSPEPESHPYRNGRAALSGDLIDSREQTSDVTETTVRQESDLKPLAPSV